jgi:precorrin-6Y C5,15-methyltransferase (decarboxylating)
VAGRAPDALAALPDPDAAFVGGGGADLEPILRACAERARRVVVATLALVERAGPALECLRAAGLEADGTLLQASRLHPLAGGHRLAAENPVVVVWGRRA